LHDSFKVAALKLGRQIAWAFGTNGMNTLLAQGGHSVIPGIGKIQSAFLSPVTVAK